MAMFFASPVSVPLTVKVIILSFANLLTYWISNMISSSRSTSINIQTTLVKHEIILIDNKWFPTIYWWHIDLTGNRTQRAEKLITVRNLSCAQWHYMQNYIVLHWNDHLNQYIQITQETDVMLYWRFCR